MDGEKISNEDIKLYKRILWCLKMEKMRLGRILEFFIIGVAMGIVEDILAVTVSTGSPVTWKIILVVTLVAIPFAIISDLIVDHFKLFNQKK